MIKKIIFCFAFFVCVVMSQSKNSVAGTYFDDSGTEVLILKSNGTAYISLIALVDINPEKGKWSLKNKVITINFPGLGIPPNKYKKIDSGLLNVETDELEWVKSE